MKTIFTFLSLSIFLFSSKAQIASVQDKTYGITFSIPWVNNYRYVDYQLGTTGKKTGFFGLGIAGYCKVGKNKISFNKKG